MKRIYNKCTNPYVNYIKRRLKHGKNIKATVKQRRFVLLWDRLVQGIAHRIDPRLRKLCGPTGALVSRKHYTFYLSYSHGSK